MSGANARVIPAAEEIEEAIGIPAYRWARQCHAISLKIVRSGLLGRPGTEARVARGFCKGVGSQHSWIVLGRDCYDPELWIADPTLWSYTGGDPSVSAFLNHGRRHRPHGHGSIWSHGAPPGPAGMVIRLKGDEALSVEARGFLVACGPLDRRGWMFLAKAPVHGWPSREIIEAICDTPALGRALVPIDILGMLTDRNPNGLYW